MESGTQVTHRLIVEANQSNWSGSLPDPDSIAKYEAICKGAADRIIVMAERQGDHRREMERNSVEAQICDLKDDRRERKLGQILGFGIAIAIVIAGFAVPILSPYQAGQIVGPIAGGTSAVALVSLFVLGREKKKEERKKLPEDAD